jgi:hypothetical protein
MWSIACLVNTVAISEEARRELFELQDFDGEFWDDKDSVTILQDDDIEVLCFNEDHQEHMDYLGSNDEIVAVLKKHKVKGEVCFGSLEGDNTGEFWGYRFDGKGGMIALTGSIEFKESKE